MPHEKRPVGVKVLISNALCELIAENKPYDSISLQDIVNQAGVCRNSFYRNFRSKEDIFKERFKEVVTQTDAFFKENKDISQYGLLFSIASVMQQNRSFLMCFYQANARWYFETLIRQIEESNTEKPIASVSADQYYTYAARAWISMGILTEWLQRDCDMSVKEIANKILAYFPN